MEKLTSDFFVNLAERATTDPKGLMTYLIEANKTAPGQVRGMLASISNSHPDFVKEVSSKFDVSQND